VKTETKTEFESAETGAKPTVHFSSESLLREAIRALLSRIPEVSLIQITHGAQELGKDIIFYLAGGLGERMLCACVVKNSPLDGKSGGSSKGALSVLHQAEQSLLNPKKMENGTQVQIQKVFIVTPFDLPDTTLNAIFGHLKDRAGRVEFIGGTKLFNLIRKYWPEFVSDEFTAIREHLRSTSAQLKEERPLEQLAITYGLATPDRSIIRYYVQPQFHQELIAARLDPQLSSIVYKDFRVVMVQEEAKYKGLEPVWIPANPRRISISRGNVDECRSSHEKIAEIFEFLVKWEYCDPRIRDEIVSLSSEYLDLVSRLREEHLKVDELERNRIIKELSKNTTLANLSLAETKRINGYITILSSKIAKALQRLKADLTIADQVVQDPKISGLHALQDARYRIATNVTDVYQLAPAGLFSIDYKPLETSMLSPGAGSENESESGQRQGVTIYTRARIVTFPNSFLDAHEQSVLITGAAGFGKTSFCRWHALHDAEQFANGTSNCLPAYFPLHQIARGELVSFESTFLDNVGQSALIPEKFQNYTVTQERIRLYLDGLDEIPLLETRKKIVEMVKRGLGSHKNIQAVFTARDYVLGPWLAWLPKFHLSEFTQGQVQELVRNWFDGEPKRLDAFNYQLARAPGLNGLLAVPLLATLVILVFRLTGDLPSSRKRLYEIFVELLNASWDLAKGVQRGFKFGPAIKMSLLKRLAYVAHSKRVRNFPESLIKTTFRSALKSDASLMTMWKELLDEILQDGLLIASGTFFSFAHLSIQEFLAAANLAGDPNNDRRSHILGEFLRGNNWWRETLMFYLELSSNTKELSEWISDAAGKTGNRDMAESQARALLLHMRTSFPDLLI
jgi:hypothetical protein